MRKIIVIAKREYNAAVKTRGFLISLIMLPILMGASMAISMLSQNRVDTDDKRIVVIDHSGLFREALSQRADEHNEKDIYREPGHEKTGPAYILEFAETDSSGLQRLKLELSERVKTKVLTGFLEIGPGVLHPDDNPENAYLRFYSEGSILDGTSNWFNEPINSHLRKLRALEMNLSPDTLNELFYYAQVEGLGLLSLDTVTGDIKDAEESNVFSSILLPYIMVMLMFMMAMWGAVPLLTAVMEEKMERISEVLLANVTPTQFMAGKVLGATAVSLTTASIYIVAGLFVARQMDVSDMFSTSLLIWFFLYLIFFLIMGGAVMSALGSTCNDNKDAQNMSFPAMMPILIPLFVVMPVLQDPSGDFATWMSLFPPFTPMLMMVRMATAVTIPAWQPVAGLAGVMLFTWLSVVAGARIFRTGILIQGQKPTFANIIRYALKG